MAEQVRIEIGADVGVGTTGNTGEPSEGKPAGLTFIAVALPSGETWVRRYADDFGPGRNDERAVRMSFRLIRDALEGRARSRARRVRQDAPDRGVEAGRSVSGEGVRAGRRS